MSSSALQVTAPGRVKIWLLATRPATLGASVAPVLVGSALAWQRGAFEPLAALCCALGAGLLQIGANLANDYFDFKNGADGADRLGPARVTQKGWVKPSRVGAAAALVLGAAIIPGVYLVALGGWPVIVTGLVSAFFAVAYTGWPLRYGYRGLGDLAVLIFFGPVAVGGSFFVQVGRLDADAVYAALPVGLLITAILVVNNIRDRKSDARANKRTLAVRIGLRASRAQYALMLGLAYLIPTALVVSGRAPLGWLGGWVSAPLALLRVSGIYRRDGAALNVEIGATARLALLYSVFFSAAVLAW